jgi:Flp pilus assembly pilin Flp
MMNASGNTVSEYGIIAALIMAVCLGSLQLMGSNLDGVMNQFAGSLKLKSKPALAESITVNPQDSSSQQVSTANQVWTFQTTSGFKLNLQSYPQNIEKAIITAGANGTTEIILGNLNSLIRQLQESGEITKEQASLLTALSNQGHEIAKIEALLETTQANSTSRSEFLNSKITYNGQTYTPVTLADEIMSALTYGYRPVRGPQIQKFLDLKAQASAQGALKDPTINKIITLMTNQIIAIANSVETGVSQIKRNRSATMANGLPSDPEVLYYLRHETPVRDSLESLASNVTDYKSAVICTTGGATDSGRNCDSR